MSPTFRARVSWLLAATVLVTLAGDSAVLARRQQKPAVPTSVAVEQHLVTESARTAARRANERDRAIRDLFFRRAQAVRGRDRAAFLGVVDPKARDYRAEQEQVFDSLGKLEFAEWTYTPRPDESYSVTSIDWQKYAGAEDLWLPVLTLRYQLAGFDAKPVGRRVVYTVVRRDGRWYIGDDRDLENVTSSGTSVRVDPWENGPIVVQHTKHGLVIGHPKDAGAIRTVMTEVESAIAHVRRFVGRGWGEKVVVVLPADHDELNRVLENPQVPFDFAAVAKPLPTLPADDFSFRELAGTRVVINPEHFRAGDPFTRVLIRHEMTHVATFARTGPLTPKWLIEGLAEYVGESGGPFSTANVGGDLGVYVDEHGVPNHLPSESDFGRLNEAGVGYASGWLLCRYIADRWGVKALLRLYDAAGDLRGNGLPGEQLDRALRRVLHVDEAALLRGWRPYVRAAVADLSKLLVKPGGKYTLDDDSELDPGDLAYLYDVKVKRVDAIGAERGAVAIWNVGDEDKPRKRMLASLIVSRDEHGAAEMETIVAARYRKYDPSGRPIPHGRLYSLGQQVGGQHYNKYVAVLRAGTVVIEVAVLVPGFGVAAGEAQALAERQYAEITA